MGTLRAGALAALVVLGGIGLTGCAKLTETELTWCGYHRDEVRQAAAELGTNDEIDWAMQGPPDQYDATYADACRQALEGAPSPN